MASVLRKAMANATSCNLSRGRFLGESATTARLTVTRFFSVQSTTSSEAESKQKAEDRRGSDIVPLLTVKGPPEELKMENPFQSRGPKEVIAVNELKEEEGGGKKGVLVRITLPGVGEDGIRVWVEENRVYFVGKGEVEREGEESGREYGGSLEFNPEFNKVDEVKAEMKNGILRMIIPSSD